jgi:hypothetical protein
MRKQRIDKIKATNIIYEYTSWGPHALRQGKDDVEPPVPLAGIRMDGCGWRQGKDGWIGKNGIHAHP